MEGNAAASLRPVYADPAREAAFRFWQRRLLPGIAADVRETWQPLSKTVANVAARAARRHLIDAGLPAGWVEEAVRRTRLDRDWWGVNAA